MLKPNGEERLQAAVHTTPLPEPNGANGPFTAFFYGTLQMAPEVLFSVIYGQKKPGKVFEDLHTINPAILNGHVRRRVSFADYPGVVPQEGESVRGMYVTGLTDANIGRLDVFEGVEYVRRKVQVRLIETDEVKETETYIYLHPDHLEKGEWDFEHFKKEKLALWSRA
ncbi:hypothetical protein jhhlp_002604 [Lomentospora prolificans]|uniref:Putative gamma-glutamylcyclotransferase n=1 Tax=Lomentospora prolificans TaxID=41688 RepID=A0A2N3NEM8_9PEZI|nr:hypothetical protein jhhlp_002604 [Lomentospora prolificans]